LSGPEIERAVLSLDAAAEVSRKVVPDDEREIRGALEAAAGADFILTTGGTGISPRDVTPEVTMKFCDKELPGIAEVLRAQSYRQTPAAVLSRAYAGLHGRSVVVNFPGSLNAVRLCMRVLGPVMEHAVRMLDGASH